jgi:DNA-binding FrmR family transcriptional regulator
MSRDQRSRSPSASSSARYEPTKVRHDGLTMDVANLLRSGPIAAKATEALASWQQRFDALRAEEQEAFLVRASNAALPPNEPWSRERLRYVCQLQVQQRTWKGEPLTSAPAQSEAHRALDEEQRRAAAKAERAQKEAAKEANAYTPLPDDAHVGNTAESNDEEGGGQPAAAKQPAAAAASLGDTDPAAGTAPGWRDVLKLVAALRELEADERFPSHVREAVNRHIAPRLARSAFLRQDLRDIAHAIDLKLGVEAERLYIKGTVTLASRAVTALTPDVQNCEQLLRRALDDGEMAMAEKVADGQLKLYQRLLALVESQYDALDHQQRSLDEAQRKRRWSIFRAARHDVGAVLRRTKRRMDALEDDAARVRYLIEEATADDEEQGKQYDARMEALQGQVAAVDSAIGEKQEAIAALLAKVAKVESEVSTLADKRLALAVERSVVLEEEAKRVSSHDSLLFESNRFLQDAKEHLDRLASAHECATTINDIVLDGTTTVTERYDAARKRAEDLTLSINREHVQLLSEYALCMTRQCHRKLNQWRLRSDARLSAEMQLDLATETFNPEAKRHANDRDTHKVSARDVMDQLEDYRAEYGDRLAVFDQRCAPNLRKHGCSFVHPAEVAGAALMHRRETIVDWRDAVDATPAKVAAALDRERKAVADGMQRLRMAEATRRLRSEARAGSGPNSEWSRASESDASVAARRRPRTAATIRPAGEQALRDSLKRFDAMGERLGQMDKEARYVGGSHTAACVGPHTEHATDAGPSRGGVANSGASAQRTPVRPTGRPPSAVARTPPVQPQASTDSRSTARPVTAPAAQHGYARQSSERTVGASTNSEDDYERDIAEDDGSADDEALDEHAAAAAAAAAAFSNVPAPAVDGSERVDDIDATVTQEELHKRTAIATAMYPYAAAAPDELALQPGDIVIVLGPTEDPGWYRGSCAHRIGAFPANYVRFEEKKRPATAQQAHVRPGTVPCAVAKGTGRPPSGARHPPSASHKVGAGARATDTKPAAATSTEDAHVGFERLVMAQPR